ncbi:hypothetical protein RDV89_10690 [Nocardioides zeae]|uniref:Uncharacterized protein n=1 Tax=Nocardioides imazamoxiresistens TaxID=3231893 RepID=A0ABU3PXN0_9ACTN|nr:hypothetical protein [Nocardioides zeae]MDT9593535.1 hypothetical protein [Nocardioides zeae]
MRTFERVYFWSLVAFSVVVVAFAAGVVALQVAGVGFHTVMVISAVVLNPLVVALQWWSLAIRRRDRLAKHAAAITA